MTGWWDPSLAPPAWSLWMLPYSLPMRPTDSSPLFPKLRKKPAPSAPNTHTQTQQLPSFRVRGVKTRVLCFLALWKTIQIYSTTVGHPCPPVKVCLENQLHNWVGNCFQTTLHDCVLCVFVMLTQCPVLVLTRWACGMCELFDDCVYTLELASVVFLPSLPSFSVIMG